MSLLIGCRTLVASVFRFSSCGHVPAQRFVQSKCVGVSVFDETRFLFYYTLFLRSYRSVSVCCCTNDQSHRPEVESTRKEEVLDAQLQICHGRFKKKKFK